MSDFDKFFASFLQGNLRNLEVSLRTNKIIIDGELDGFSYVLNIVKSEFVDTKKWCLVLINPKTNNQIILKKSNSVIFLYFRKLLFISKIKPIIVVKSLFSCFYFSLFYLFVFCLLHLFHGGHADFSKQEIHHDLSSFSSLRENVQPSLPSSSVRLAGTPRDEKNVPLPAVDMKNGDNQILMKSMTMLSKTGHVYTSDFEGMKDENLKNGFIDFLKKQEIKTKNGKIYKPFIDGVRPPSSPNTQKQVIDQKAAADEILSSPRHGAPPGDSTDAYLNAEEMNKDYPISREAVGDSAAKAQTPPSEKEKVPEIPSH